MTSTVRICVVGSANVDLTFRTPRLPRPGETLAGRSLHVGMGGKGANQAVAAARLGARVTLVARVGNDAFGADAVASYRAAGIDTSFVRVDPDRPTGTAAIMVDDAAENCIVVVAGANAGLSVADVQAAAAAIQGAGAVLCQLETPVETTLEAFRIARAASVQTILTPAPAAALPDELLRLCDVCIPNRTELELLTGRPVHSLDHVAAAALALRERVSGAVVVTLGEMGVLVIECTETTHIPGIKVEAIDPTGA